MRVEILEGTELTQKQVFAAGPVRTYAPTGQKYLEIKCDSLDVGLYFDDEADLERFREALG